MPKGANTYQNPPDSERAWRPGLPEDEPVFPRGIDTSIREWMLDSSKGKMSEAPLNLAAQNRPQRSRDRE